MLETIVANLEKNQFREALIELYKLPPEVLAHPEVQFLSAFAHLQVHSLRRSKEALNIVLAHDPTHEGAVQLYQIVNDLLSKPLPVSSLGYYSLEKIKRISAIPDARKVSSNFYSLGGILHRPFLFLRTGEGIIVEETIRHIQTSDIVSSCLFYDPEASTPKVIPSQCIVMASWTKGSDSIPALLDLLIKDDLSPVLLISEEDSEARSYQYPEKFSVQVVTMECDCSVQELLIREEPYS